MGPNPMEFTKQDARRERIEAQAAEQTFSGMEITDSFSNDEFAALDALCEQCQDGSYPDAYLGEVLRKLVLGRVEAMRDAMVAREMRRAA